MENLDLKKLEEYVGQEDGINKELHLLDVCCQDITEECQISVFLEEARLENGEIANKVPTGDRTVLKEFAEVELSFNMTNKFVTVVIRFKDKYSTDKSAIYNLYNIYQTKASEYFRKGLERLSVLSFYFVHQDEMHGIASVISCVNPVLVIKNDEEGTLTGLFEYGALHYGVQLINYDEIDEKIQYEVADEMNVLKREERRAEENRQQEELAKQYTNILDEDF